MKKLLSWVASQLQLDAFEVVDYQTTKDTTTTIIRSPSGQSYRVVRSVRFFRPIDMETVELLGELKREGIAVVVPLLVDVERQLTVYPQLEVTTLASFEAPPHTARFSMGEITELGRIYGQLHGLFPSVTFNPVWPEPTPRKSMFIRSVKVARRYYRFFFLATFHEAAFSWLQYGNSQRGIPRKVLKEIVEQLPSVYTLLQTVSRTILPPPNFFLVHGDPHPENILRIGGKLWLTDFELWHYDDPASELAFLAEELDQTGRLTNKLERRLIESYQQSFHATTNLSDPTFMQRYRMHRIATLYRFIGSICIGVARRTGERYNRPLLIDLIERAKEVKDCVNQK